MRPLIKGGFYLSIEENFKRFIFKGVFYLWAASIYGRLLLKKSRYPDDRYPGTTEK